MLELVYLRGDVVGVDLLLGEVVGLAILHADIY